MIKCRWLKTGIFLFILSMGLFSIFGCSASSSQARIQVLNERGDNSWIMDGIRVMNHPVLGSEKAVVFVGVGLAQDSDIAGETAKLDALGLIAVIIKGVIQKQRMIVQNQLGTAGQIESLNSQFEVTIARNAVVSGAQTLETYSRVIKFPNSSKSFHQWFVRMAIPYSRLKQQRDKFLAEYQRQNAAYRDKWKLVFTQFEKLDSFADAGVGHIELTPEERDRRSNPRMPG